jgi:PGF-pre-PGF domain-containing protein
VSVSTYEADLTLSDRLQIGDSATAASQSNSASSTTAIETAAESFERTTGTVAAGYAVIETNLNETEITGATFGFRVSDSYLSEIGADPADVTLYRQTGDEWNAKETAYLGESGDFHEYEGTMPGFSMFALGTGTDVLSIDGNLSVTAAGTDDTTISVGDEVVVRGTVENHGQTPANETFTLRANGEIVDSEEISLAGSTNGSIRLRFTPDTAGEYTLTVDDQELPLTVAERNRLPWWLILIIGIVIVVFMIIWRRRIEDEEEATTGN